MPNETTELVTLPIGFYLLAVAVGLVFHLVFVLNVLFDLLSFDLTHPGWFRVRNERNLGARSKKPTEA